MFVFGCSAENIFEHIACNLYETKRCYRSDLDKAVIICHLFLGGSDCLSHSKYLRSDLFHCNVKRVKVVDFAFFNCQHLY